MSSKVKVWVVFALSAFLGLFAPRYAEPASAEAVIATINGEPVSRTDFRRALVRSLGRATLNQFLDWKLIEQAAARRNITITEKELADRQALEIKLRIRKVYEQSRTTALEFEKIASSYGWDPQQIREEAASTVRPEVVKIRVLAEKILRPHLKITEEDLRDYYAWTYGERISLAHISAPNKEIAEKMLAALKEDPNRWGTAVERYSLDRESAPYRGRLLPIPASTKIGQSVQGLRPGEFTLYHDGRLWHILRFIRRIQPQKDFESSQSQLKRELYAREVQDVIQIWLAQLHATSTVVTNISADPHTRRILGARVAAFVNGQSVSVQEFGEALLQQFGEKLINSYIERKLIFQEASRRGIKIPEEQIKNQQFKMAESIFSERASAEGMSARRYETKLRDQGIPPELLKEKIAREMVSREIVETVLLAEKVVGKPKDITNSEIKKAYKSLYEEHLDVRRIVVADPARARWVRSRVFSDVRFETLVRAESLEPLSWMRGGLVKGITTGDPYYKYVQNLEVGRVSPIFRHNGNFHIAKVVARFNPTDPPPMEEVQDKVKARAEELKTRKRIKAWVQKIKAESEINVKL